MDRTTQCHLAAIQDHDLVGDLLNFVEVERHQQDGGTRVARLEQPAAKFNSSDEIISLAPNMALSSAGMAAQAAAATAPLAMATGTKTHALNDVGKLKATATEPTAPR